MKIVLNAMCTVTIIALASCGGSTANDPSKLTVNKSGEGALVGFAGSSWNEAEIRKYVLNDFCPNGDASEIDVTPVANGHSISGSC